MSKENLTQLVLRAKELIPSLWVEKHSIKNEMGLPIEFDNHYFMRDMIDDMSRLQVWLKPPQIGATIAQIIKSFWCAMKMHWDIIYTLPTQSDVEDMAGGKINRVIAQNGVLQSWVKEHDTVKQKLVGSNTIHYRGTFTAKAAMMVSSHLNIHDEVDASDQQVIEQYENRLMAKPVEEQRRWYFSHPSLVGVGVDTYWEQSDKKEWFIKCPNCHKEQQLTWPENINLTTRKYVCQTCKHELTDDSRKYGAWRATSSGVFSGYHITQLMCVWISADKIINDWDTKDEQYFYNYVLGLPYIGSDNKIEPNVVLNNVSPLTNLQQGRVIIGVDTGLPIHYVCMNQEGVFYYNTIEKPSDAKPDWDAYDALEKLLLHFKNSIIVADQGGDLLGIRRLQSKYPGRVFLCYYRKDRKSEKIINWGENDEYGKVVVDRNRQISLMVEHLRQPGYIVLNGDKTEWELFASHFGNIYREQIVQKETVGKDAHTLYGTEYVWKRNGPDHFVHALVYTLVGYDRFGNDAVTIVRKNDSFMANVPVASDVHGVIPVRRISKKFISRDSIPDF